MIFLLAGIPRARISLFSLSRNSREHAFCDFLSRGIPASMPFAFFSLAEFPRACLLKFSLSRDSREQANSLWQPRGTSASVPKVVAFFHYYNNVLPYTCFFYLS